MTLKNVLFGYKSNRPLLGSVSDWPISLAKELMYLAYKTSIQTPKLVKFVNLSSRSAAFKLAVYQNLKGQLLIAAILSSISQEAETSPSPLSSVANDLF